MGKTTRIKVRLTKHWCGFQSGSIVFVTKEKYENMVKLGVCTAIDIPQPKPKPKNKPRKKPVADKMQKGAVTKG